MTITDGQDNSSTISRPVTVLDPPPPPTPPSGGGGGSTGFILLEPLLLTSRFRT